MPDYFYRQHGRQYGPVAGRELQVLARKGQLEPDAQVWAEGTTKRLLAKNVKNLFQNQNETKPIAADTETDREPIRSSAPVPPPPPLYQAEQWHVQMANGQRYGPITKAELDLWAAERRVNAECQVWRVGWPQWKPASDVYPALAAPASTPAYEPPVSSPAATSTPPPAPFPSAQKPKQGVASQLVQYGIKELTDPEKVKARHQQWLKDNQKKRANTEKLLSNPLTWVVVGGFCLLFFLYVTFVAILTSGDGTYRRPSNDMIGSANTLQGAKANAIGVWRWSDDLEGIKFTESITFREDGSYEQRGWDSYTDDVKIESVGTWSIEQDGDQYLVRLNHKSGYVFNMTNYDTFFIEDGVLRSEQGTIYQK